MICRVEMPSNEALFIRFYRYQLLHGAANQGKGGLFLVPGLFVMMIVMLLIMGVSYVILAALALFIIGYAVYMLSLRPASVFKRKNADGGALQTETFIFSPRSYTRSLRHEEGGMMDNTSGQYSALVKAVETRKDFYLYTSRSQAWLVDKEYFTNGTPEDLRTTLRAALGDKFISKQQSPA